MLALSFDLRNPLHRLDSRLDKLAVVAYGNIPALLELDSRILEIQLSSVYHNVYVSTHHCHLLACRLAERLRPTYFTGVALHSTEALATLAEN